MRSDFYERSGWCAGAGMLLGLAAAVPAAAGSVELQLPFTYSLAALVEPEPETETDEPNGDQVFALQAVFDSLDGGPDERFAGRTDLVFDSFAGATGITDASRFQSATLAVDHTVNGAITNDTGVNPTTVATSGTTTVGTRFFGFNLDLPSELLPITDTLAVSRSSSGSNASDAVELADASEEGFGVALISEFDYTFSTVGDFDANGGFKATGMATLTYTFADLVEPPAPSPPEPTPNPVPTPTALPLGLAALAWAGRRRRGA